MSVPTGSVAAATTMKPGAAGCEAGQRCTRMYLRTRKTELCFQNASVLTMGSSALVSLFFPDVKRDALPVPRTQGAAGGDRRRRLRER